VALRRYLAFEDSHDKHGENHMSVTTLVSGRIVKVAGPVVDIQFPKDSLPEINFALEVNLTVDGV